MQGIPFSALEEAGAYNMPYKDAERPHFLGVPMHITLRKAPMTNSDIKLNYIGAI